MQQWLHSTAVGPMRAAIVPAAARRALSAHMQGQHA
jgi:hypothetical protein